MLKLDRIKPTTRLIFDSDAVPPSFNIGGLKLFYAHFLDFYDAYNCIALDLDKNNLFRENFSWMFFKELFSRSTLSQKLFEKMYQLNADQYNTLDKYLDMNTLEVVYDVFLKTYFKVVTRLLNIFRDSENRDHILLLVYTLIWADYLRGSQNLEHRFQAVMHKMYKKPTIEGRVEEYALNQWKQFFFKGTHSQDFYMPTAIHRLLENELCGVKPCPDLKNGNLIHSYHKLGLMNLNLPHSHQILLADWYNFVQFHRSCLYSIPVKGGVLMIKKRLVSKYGLTEYQAQYFTENFSWQMLGRIMKLSGNNLKQAFFGDRPIDAIQMRHLDEEFKDNPTELTMDKFKNWLVIVKTKRPAIEEISSGSKRPKSV